MHATIRRYEGVDTNRTDELTAKVGESLVPELRKLEGFQGYYLIEAGNGVISSFGLFDTPSQVDEATKVACELWGRARLTADETAVDAHRTFDILCG